MSIETNHTDAADPFARDRDPAVERGASADRERDEEFPLQLERTTLAELCRQAVDDVEARFPERTVEYAPDAEGEGAGEWDARRIRYAVTILLEDALKRTTAGEPVSLRWRAHGSVAVLRVQFGRPLGRGDRFVTYFEDGVHPDGADDEVGTLRVAAARKIVRQHRGELARIRTRAGTAYVATLPCSATVELADADGDADV